MIHVTLDNFDMNDRKKAVIADVGITLFDGEFCDVFSATGSSRRMQEDEWDESLGMLIAYTRAVENLAAAMKVELKKRLKAADLVKEQ